MSVKLTVSPNMNAESDVEFFGTSVELDGARALAVLEAAGLAVGSESAVLECFAGIKPEPIKWLWPGRIALGKLTLIVGDPGLGKSFLTLDLAARISRRDKWPDKTQAPLGSVILLSAEDDPADTIRPRLDTAGADPARIHILKAVREENQEGDLFERTPKLDDVAALAEAIDRVGDVKLLVVDPISAYIGGKIDSHKNSDIRSLLAPLSALASQHNISIIGVSHLNKSQGNAIYRTTGSLAFTAAARAVWCVTKDPDNEGKRFFLPVKNNLGPDQTGHSFEIAADGEPRILWDRDPVTIDINEVINFARDEDRTERDEAAEWLQTLLADGPMSAKEVKREASQAGIAWRTLRRAKDGLGIKPSKTRFDGGWEWCLPKVAKGSRPNNVAPFGVGGPLRVEPEENSPFESTQNTEDAQGVHLSTTGELGHLGPRGRCCSCTNYNGGQCAKGDTSKPCTPQACSSFEQQAAS